MRSARPRVWADRASFSSRVSLSGIDYDQISGQCMCRRLKYRFPPDAIIFGWPGRQPHQHAPPPSSTSGRRGFEYSGPVRGRRLDEAFSDVGFGFICTPAISSRASSSPGRRTSTSLPTTCSSTSTWARRSVWGHARKSPPGPRGVLNVAHHVTHPHLTTGSAAFVPVRPRHRGGGGGKTRVL
jgi:hypothetical protein